MNLPSDRGNCPLCATPPATSVVVQGPRWRLQRAEEAGFPAFYRLVWQAHVAEMSDLSAPERQECMELVNLVEALMRSHLRPDKVNLASLGNMVPHLHWHVIGRYAWDSHFPSPVWCPAQRTADAARLADLQARLPAFEQALTQALAIG